ncbi:MAG: mechanosensitive ion channel [Rhodothermales bacterium]|nr:mechanosensitive ion channel [Rhodothermales bacterium]
MLAGLLLFGACGNSEPPEPVTGVPLESSLEDVMPSDTVRTVVEPPDSSQAALVDSSDLARRLSSIEDKLAAIEKAISQTEPPSSRASTDTISTASPRDALGSAADNLGNFGLKIFFSIILLFLMYFFIKIVVWILDTASERSASRRLFFKKLIPIVRIVFWSFVIYLIIAKVFNVDRQGLLAAGAALGVAVGFAAQDVLKNIFGGILIILDQPFQVGDKINVGGTYGEVVSIGLRSTRIVTPDDNLVSVPNTQVVDGQVANANAGALHCQVVTTLYLPGDTDVAKARKIAYEAAANSKYVYLDKPIVVLVKDFYEYRFLTKILVKAYVLDTRYEFAFASEITETAKAEFLKAGLLTTDQDVAAFDHQTASRN